MTKWKIITRGDMPKGVLLMAVQHWPPLPSDDPVLVLANGRVAKLSELRNDVPSARGRGR